MINDNDYLLEIAGYFRIYELKFSFTTYVDDLRSTNKTIIIPFPAMVGGNDRLVCMRADDEPSETEICRKVIYKEQPLEVLLFMLKNKR